MVFLKAILASAFAKKDYKRAAATASRVLQVHTIYTLKTQSNNPRPMSLLKLIKIWFLNILKVKD